MSQRQFNKEKADKNRRFIFYFPEGNIQPFSRKQGFSRYFQDSSARQTLKYQQLPPPTLFLYIWLLNRHYMVWNNPSVSLNQLPRPFYLPWSCPPPTHWWEGEMLERTALIMCQHGSAVAKTLVCYQHLSVRWQKALWGLLWGALLHLIQTQYKIYVAITAINKCNLNLW